MMSLSRLEDRIEMCNKLQMIVVIGMIQDLYQLVDRLFKVHARIRTDEAMAT